MLAISVGVVLTCVFSYSMILSYAFVQSKWNVIAKWTSLDKTTFGTKLFKLKVLYVVGWFVLSFAFFLYFMVYPFVYIRRLFRWKGRV